MARRKIDEDKMIIGYKIRLNPTKEQELLFWKSAGCARWCYNYYISRKNEEYRKTGNNDNITPKLIDHEIVLLKEQEEYKWLTEVGSQTLKEAIRDCQIAFDRAKNGISGRPKYKKKFKSKPSFYVRYDTLKKTEIGFQGERLGEIETCSPLPTLPKWQKNYSNPRVTFDGKYWYLSVGIEIGKNYCETTSTVLGIDLGIKELAICSDGNTYKNINKTKEVKRLEKKLKREQRKLSRMMLLNTDHYEMKVSKKDGKEYQVPVYKRPLRECKNITKQNLVINRLYKRLTDIRNNHLHQTTTEIINRKPKVIVLEDLKVNNMMKNKHLSKAIKDQKFYEFKRQIQYKAEKVGIEVKLVDTFYPSSKRCSRCGHIKKDLKLSDRIYECSECGLILDRDFNASLNLVECYINNHNLVEKKKKKSN